MQRTANTRTLLPNHGFIAAVVTRRYCSLCIAKNQPVCHYSYRSRMYTEGGTTSSSDDVEDGDSPASMQLSTGGSQRTKNGSRAADGGKGCLPPPKRYICIYGENVCDSCAILACLEEGKQQRRGSQDGWATYQFYVCRLVLKPCVCEQSTTDAVHQ